MSGIIAAHRVRQAPVILQAENIRRFSGAVYGLGHYSFKFDDGFTYLGYAPVESHAVVLNKDFAEPYTGNIRISGNLNLAKNFTINTQGNGVISMDTAEYLKLKAFPESGTSTPDFNVHGDVVHLPRNSATMFYVYGNLTGRLLDLPPSLKVFAIYRENTLTGNIKDLPSTVHTVVLQNNTNIEPIVFSDIPNHVKSVELKFLPFGIIDTLANVPDSITDLNLNLDANTSLITGDISDIPNITNLQISGPNAVTGNVADFNRMLRAFYISGSNEITGQISDIPATATYFVCEGYNTLGGDIGAISFPANSFQIKGNNAIGGNIANIPHTILYLQLWGNNTLTGNIADINRNIQQFDIRGNNTVTGDLNDFPKLPESISIGGNNTIYGDIADISGKRFIELSGNLNCRYSSAVWVNVYGFWFTPQITGLSSTEVDQLLTDLSAANWSVYKVLDLRGANAPRTAASSGAVALLQSKGVTVLTN